MAEDTTTDAGTATDTDADNTTTTGQQTAATDLGDAGKRALAEERRARKAAERELEALRKTAMTEQERAIADAKTAALTEATRAAGPRLVRAELRAAAAEAGLSKAALDGFLEYADLARFLTDDGEPDSKTIAAAVKRLGGGTGRADFDGGARGGTARPQNMSDLIRQKAGVI
jgi:DNA-binding phage protein